VMNVTDADDKITRNASAARGGKMKPVMTEETWR